MIMVSVALEVESTLMKIIGKRAAVWSEEDSDRQLSLKIAILGAHELMIPGVFKPRLKDVYKKETPAIKHSKMAGRGDF